MILWRARLSQSFREHCQQNGKEHIGYQQCTRISKQAKGLYQRAQRDPGTTAFGSASRSNDWTGESVPSAEACASVTYAVGGKG